MIDIHTHILPGIDDGAQSLEEAIKMAQLALNSGVDTLVVTPHCNAGIVYDPYYAYRMRTGFQTLLRALEYYQLPLKLLPGMEIFGTEEVPELLAEGMLLTLNHSRYLLLEFDPMEDVEWIDFLLALILEQGYCPIIAHPERYFHIQRYPELARRWTRMGGALQVNKGSIMGGFGTLARDAALYLLENRLASFVASDAHSPKSRTTCLAKVYQFIRSNLTQEYADILLFENPNRVIGNRELIDLMIKN